MSPKKSSTRTKWESFRDQSYYDLWAVRPIGDHDFQSPRLFHFVEKADAELFLELISKSYHAVRG
jgi:hypothetical protein